MHQLDVPVVVAGGAGFIGSHLCEALHGSGAAVVCIDNMVTGSPENIAHLVGDPRFALIEHDISQPLPATLPAASVVFHLASPASPLAYGEHPVETLEAGSLGTFNLMRYAQECGARFVLASTSEVYGDPLEHPQRETYRGNVSPVGPRCAYDESKRFSEAVAATFARYFGADVGIARIFNTFGSRMQRNDGRLVPAAMCQALTDAPISVYGSGEQTRSLCHVSDTVAGLLALARSAQFGPFNIGNPDEMPVLEIAQTIRDLCGSSSPIIHTDPVDDDPRVRCPDISRATEQLDWQPEVATRDGLLRTIPYFRAVVTAAA
ncbi:GDP-mannose 4,6-dehydratase [Hoyosella sp. YIM 151337]|uniref:NAD-dependent epimerase/dehydratase family protein n=1 Tax=Hoyosella sp. YIM 151337 TaxID=2992742 RepID=UPI002235E69C|nr:NAD-dependent epimerase/dehydratase family protein [Hoyosella sp. YIM 151337]MCW4355512.1 GDP-mannose 4,6-dehydratase [Hoyosella sp. YIM 151337]